MKYLILMQVNNDVLEKLTDEQGKAMQEGHAAFMKATRESGEFIGTQALAAPSESKVVRGRGGKKGPEVTDGPFMEAKEYFGGYYLIDVENQERAIELAKMIPDANIDGLALEVRPVMFEDGFDA